MSHSSVALKGGTSGLPAETVLTESGPALNVYQTAHEGSAGIHFHVDNLASPGTYYYILIDISDTVNYKHTGGEGYVHLQSLDIGVTCNTNGEWTISFGFLEEMSVLGSKKYIQNHWRGSKSTGNSLELFENYFPVGQHMNSDFLATHPPSQSSDFQSDIMVKSTLSPDIPDTLPGNGDIFLITEVTDGVIEELKLNLNYHSHSHSHSQ